MHIYTPYLAYSLQYLEVKLYPALCGSWAFVQRGGRYFSHQPAFCERDEPQATLSDQTLNDPQSDLGNLVHFTTNPDLNSMVETFTESQLRAYREQK